MPFGVFGLETIAILSTSITSASVTFFAVWEGPLSLKARTEVDVILPLPVDFDHVFFIADDVGFVNEDPFEGEAVVDLEAATADNRVIFNDEATDFGVSITFVLPFVVLAVGNNRSGGVTDDSLDVVLNNFNTWGFSSISASVL